MLHHVIVLYGFGKSKDGLVQATDPFAAITAFRATLPEEIRIAVQNVFCTEMRRPHLGVETTPQVLPRATS